MWSHCSTLSSSPASLCSPLSTLFVRLALQFPVQLMSFSDHLNFCLHCLEYFFPEFRFQILHFLPFFIRCICVFLGITQTFIFFKLSSLISLTYSFLSSLSSLNSLKFMIILLYSVPWGSSEKFSLANISLKLVDFEEKILLDISCCWYFRDKIWAYALLFLLLSLMWTE